MSQSRTTTKQQFHSLCLKAQKNMGEFIIQKSPKEEEITRTQYNSEQVMHFIPINAIQKLCPTEGHIL